MRPNLRSNLRLNLSHLAAALFRRQFSPSRLSHSRCTQRRRSWGLVGITGAIAPLVLVAPVEAAELTRWSFDPETLQLEVVVPGETTPNYFLLAQPARIVLDLPNTNVGNVVEERQYSGMVRYVRVGQFQPNLTRIVIELAPDAVLAPAQVELRNVGSGSQGSSNRWVLRPLLAGDAPMAAIEPVPSTPIPEGIDEPTDTSPEGIVFEPSSSSSENESDEEVLDEDRLNEDGLNEPDEDGPNADELNEVEGDIAAQDLPPLEPGAFEIPVVIPPPIADASDRSSTEGESSQSNSDDSNTLPVAVAPPDDQASDTGPTAGTPAVEDTVSSLEPNDRETVRRIEVTTPEELQQALDQIRAGDTNIQIVRRLPNGAAPEQADTDERTVTEPVSESQRAEREGIPEIEPPNESAAPTTSELDSNQLEPSQPQLPQASNQSPIAESETSSAAPSDATSPSLDSSDLDSSDSNAAEAEPPESVAIAPSATAAPAASPETPETEPENLEDSENAEVEDGLASRTVESRSGTASSSLAFPSPDIDTGAIAPASVPEALQVLPPATLDLEEAVTVTAPALDTPPALDAEQASPSEAIAALDTERSSVSADADADIDPSPASPDTTDVTRAPEPAPLDLESPIPSPSRSERSDALPSPTTALPTTPPQNEPNDTASMGNSDRQLLVAARSGELIPSGTVLKLRYPRLTSTLLQTGIAWQDVLLLDQTILDRTGRVLVPEGSQVIGRFEVTDRQVRFVTQALALDGRNIPLRAVSSWVPIENAAAAVVIRPNQIVNVRLAESFSP